MTAYYNEWDRKKAASLRELIRRGMIAPGDVDERSITDVTPNDLVGYAQCHFFAGCGIWSYALRLAGWRDDRPVWTGSPPCQPFSVAGQRKGYDDARHLAPAWLDLVEACAPEAIFGEQVASAEVIGSQLEASFIDAVRRGDFARANKCANKLVKTKSLGSEARWLDALADFLEANSYAIGASASPACSVGAPHIRQRLYFGAVRLADAERPEGARHRQHGGEGLREQETTGFAGGCLAGGLDGTRAGAGVPQGQAVAGGVVEHQSDGREPWRAESSGRGATSGRASGGLDYAAGSRREEARSRQSDEWEGRGGGSELGRGIGRMGDMPHQRRERSGSARRRRDGPADDGATHRPGPTNGFWRDADWLYCRDGKWRPVEPGTSPLDDGASARVVRLHCYGDGIVAQQAATFIEEFRAVTEEANASTILGE